MNATLIPEAASMSSSNTVSSPPMSSPVSPIAAALQTLDAFLREDHPEVTHIDLDQDLIDSRILDSLRFMNFLFLLEELTGIPFELDRISVDDFRTLRTIETRFLKDALAGRGAHEN